MKNTKIRLGIKYEYEDEVRTRLCTKRTKTNTKNESTSRERGKTNLRHARERNSTEKYGKYVTIKIYVTIESEKISEHVRLKKRDFGKWKRGGS